MIRSRTGAFRKWAPTPESTKTRIGDGRGFLMISETAKNGNFPLGSSPWRRGIEFGQFSFGAGVGFSADLDGNSME